MEDRLDKLCHDISFAMADHENYFTCFTDFLALCILLPQKWISRTEGFSIDLITDTVNLRFDGLRDQVNKAIGEYSAKTEVSRP